MAVGAERSAITIDTVPSRNLGYGRSNVRDLITDEVRCSLERGRESEEA